MKKAFSLIELIFVIAVLGIIATVAVPKLMDTRDNAQVSTIKQDISTVISSVQSYYVVNGSLSKISDAVSLNNSVWTISDKKIEYKTDGTTCLSIEVSGSVLSLNIDETSSSEICKQLYSSGIKDISYNL